MKFTSFSRTMQWCIVHVAASSWDSRIHCLLRTWQSCGRHWWAIGLASSRL